MLKLGYCGLVIAWLVIAYGRNTAGQAPTIQALSLPADTTILSPSEPKKQVELIKTTVSLSKYIATGKPMANGEMPYVGACAVSCDTIPFGSKIKVFNPQAGCWQEYTVGDRMPLSDELKVDLFSMKSREQCLAFGRYNVEAVIKIIRN